MDSPFEYNKPVSGSTFIGRDKEVKLICNYIKERHNILIYGQARIGKKSLIYNALNTLTEESYNYTTCNVSLFNIRCLEAMMLKFTNTLLSSVSSSVIEWEEILKKYAPSAPYCIDSQSTLKAKLTHINKEHLTDTQITELLLLPDKLANDYDTHIIVYLEQFQNILLFDDPTRVFKLMESCWYETENTNFIITGERYNAMKEIFDIQKYFYNFAQKVQIIPIEEKIFSDFIVKGFLKAGKVANPEFASTMYNLVEGDPWYTQHLASICYELTKGYLNDKIVEQAIWCLINLHDFQFQSVTFNLSRHQLRYIKATLAGEDKISSFEVIEKYNLNSSANVRRIKEALIKKEIITFNENNEAVYLDPLFKLWLIKYFFIK